jgi:hypothetical protein
VKLLTIIIIILCIGAGMLAKTFLTGLLGVPAVLAFPIGMVAAAFAAIVAVNMLKGIM